MRQKAKRQSPQVLSIESNDGKGHAKFGCEPSIPCTDLQPSPFPDRFSRTAVTKKPLSVFAGAFPGVRKALLARGGGRWLRGRWLRGRLACRPVDEQVFHVGFVQRGDLEWSRAAGCPRWHTWRVNEVDHSTLSTHPGR